MLSAIRLIGFPPGNSRRGAWPNRPRRRLRLRGRIGLAIGNFAEFLPGVMPPQPHVLSSPGSSTRSRGSATHATPRCSCPTPAGSARSARSRAGTRVEVTSTPSETQLPRLAPRDHVLTTYRLALRLGMHHGRAADGPSVPEHLSCDGPKGHSAQTMWPALTDRSPAGSCNTRRDLSSECLAGTPVLDMCVMGNQVEEIKGKASHLEIHPRIRHQVACLGNHNSKTTAAKPRLLILRQGRVRM